MALGTATRNAVRSRLRTIVEHCLKLTHAPANEPRAGWMSTIGRARDEIEDRLTPTLRRGLRAGLPRLYGQARRNAARDFRLFGEAGGGGCPARALPVDARRAAAGGVVSREGGIGFAERQVVRVSARDRSCARCDRDLDLPDS